ncbi:MAG: preprotein translocase subunit YajC [Planctomycetaceae bacterium]
MDWVSASLLFAEGEQNAPQKNQGGGSELVMFAPFLVIAVLFYVLLIRPQRREQATREAMLSALKKNDKVVTIGGMIGTVANISADGQEVTLKVDDNTRIRMVRSSIQRVLTPEAEGEKPAESK